jgi:TetR/AcrR family transcriptional repressor of nem operon
MKISREQFAENRIKILDAASKLFREQGIDGVGLDAIMKAAGLTHGAFYSHFKSKDELVACACAHALGRADESWRAAPDPLSKLATLYLADDHCDNRADGCAFAALGSEVVRQSDEARKVLTGALRQRVEVLAAGLDGSSATNREQALATWAGLIGSLVLARVVNDAALSQEILKAGRSVFGRRAAGGARRGRIKKK